MINIILDFLHLQIQLLVIKQILCFFDFKIIKNKNLSSFPNFKATIIFFIMCILVFVFLFVFKLL